MGKHTEWRKLAKRTRRKRIRQCKAKLRDQKELQELRQWQNSPGYKIYLAESARAEELREEKEAKAAEEREVQWLKAEAEAQIKFRELQLKQAQARKELARQNEKIKQEWEKEQERQKELREQQEKEHEENLRQQELLDEKVSDFLENGGDTPEHLKSRLETNPNKPHCPFFQKTSACRFFDYCSRNHVRPGISKIIHIPNFFSHYSLEKTENEHTSDSSLEFESHETFEQYREFFSDVVSELEKYGKIKLFFTCCNHEAHLRGNVFIEFFMTRSALKCYKGLNGRWYGGKQLSIQFATIPSWKSAICGLHFVKRCPKGNSCNFLHVFRNPRNLYSSYEETNDRSQRHKNRESDTRNWRWSESPERISESSNREANGRNHRHKNRHKQSDTRNSRWSESPERIPVAEWETDKDDQRKSKSHSSHRSQRKQSRHRENSSSSRHSVSSRRSRNSDRRTRSRTPERNRKRARSRSKSPGSHKSHRHEMLP
ncbi:hypothetical protein JTB14_025357 [Gonioctena quinquepunctata]|nr:hypothetical protein JTB14_025357 [Gonioctena quinquepunctata]